MKQKPFDYYIRTDKGHYGPVSIDILKKLPLKRDTLLWNKNIDYWQNAEELEELKEQFKNSPPKLDSDKAFVFKQSFIQKEVVKNRIIKALKPALGISILIGVLLATSLWLTFKPNKFGQTHINKIDEYFTKEHKKYLAEEKAEKKRIRDAEEYNKLHPSSKTDIEKILGKNPFDKYKTTFQVAPAASIPYEYVEDFWDYCKDANGEVFLSLSGIQSSFDSRQTYLQKRILKLSFLAFLASFIGVMFYIFYRNSFRTKSSLEKSNSIFSKR